MVIGLTGKYCSGKNYIASLLEKRGLAVLDVDKLGHIAIENEKSAVFSRFGEDLRGSDGSVNRRLLGEKVFGKPGELADLEAIAHPEANRLTEEWLAARKDENCVINAAVLHKSSVFSRLGCIILARAPLAVRLMRAKKRDSLSWPAIVKRIASQRHFYSQYSAGNADIYIVENPGMGKARAVAALNRRIDVILSRLGL